MANAYGNGYVSGVKTRHVTRERLRVVAGGSFGSREAHADRQREEGRLSESERSELLMVWSGNEHVLGCRSSHASVVDRLLRAPPRESKQIEDAVEYELARHGRQGYARDKLVDLLADEDVATRHELRRALRAMVGRGQIEYFVAQGERPKRRRRDGAEMLTGPERRDLPDGKPEVEHVTVEMVRLAKKADRRVPEAVPPEERWRRQDEALRAYCQEIHCSDGGAGPGSRLPPRAPPSRAEDARRALRRLPAPLRRVLERAYGSASTPQSVAPWAALGDEVARLAPLTASVERARQELVTALSTPSSRATVDRSTFASDAMRAKLDAQPEGALDRARWKAEREVFVERVRVEAEGLLRKAVEAFRQTREG